MAGHIKTPMLGDPMPKELKERTRSLFRGIHVFVSGGTWDWYRPIYPGDRLYAFGGEETLDVKQSEFAGRSVVQVRRDVVINQRGDVVGVYRILRILTERKESRTGASADIEAAEYTDEDYERIDAIYAQESHAVARRSASGRTSRSATKLPPMVRGPFDRDGDDAFHAGGYGFVPYGLAAGSGYKNRKRIAPFYVKTSMGSGTSPNASTGIRNGPKRSATRSRTITA